MPLIVSRGDDPRTVVISVEGQFDFGLHREFRDAYRNLTDVNRFIVDLERTEYMDSSALGMLLLLREHGEQLGARVEIRNAGSELERILRIANFHQLFAISGG